MRVFFKALLFILFLSDFCHMILIPIAFRLDLSLKDGLVANTETSTQNQLLQCKE